MVFIEITSSSDPLFEQCWQIYTDSFPLCERRAKEQHIELMEREAMHCIAISEQHRAIGLLWYWSFEHAKQSYIYIEHLAIDSSARGGGIGKKALDYIKALGKTIILEIEPPTEPTTQRRERFYLREGFTTNIYDHQQPPYRRGDEPQPFKIMSYPAPIDAELYASFVESQRKIMPSF